MSTILMAHPHANTQIRLCLIAKQCLPPLRKQYEYMKYKRPNTLYTGQ